MRQPHKGFMILVMFLTLVSITLLCSVNLFAAVIYQDGFETADGYIVSTTENISLIGQQGWTEGAYGNATQAATFANGFSPYGDTLLRVTTSSAGTKAALYNQVLDTPISSGIVEFSFSARAASATYLDLYLGDSTIDVSADNLVEGAAITCGLNGTSGARSYTPSDTADGRINTGSLPAGWYTFHALLDLDAQKYSLQVLNADGSAVVHDYDGWDFAGTAHTYTGVGTYNAYDFKYPVTQIQNIGMRTVGMSSQVQDLDNFAISTVSTGVVSPVYTDSFEIGDGYNASAIENTTILGQQGWTAGTYGDATQGSLPADGTSPYGESMMHISTATAASETAAVYKSFTDTPITSGIVEISLNAKVASGLYADIFFGDSTAVASAANPLVGAAVSCGFSGTAGARAYVSGDRADTAAIAAGWYTFHLLLDMDAQVYSIQLLNQDGSEVVYDYDEWDITGTAHTYGDLGTFASFGFKEPVTELQNVGLRTAGMGTQTLGVDNLSITVVVPEPGMLMLLLSGLVGLLIRRRR